jgi:hypothetical protein
MAVIVKVRKSILSQHITEAPQMQAPKTPFYWGSDSWLAAPALPHIQSSVD